VLLRGAIIYFPNPVLLDGEEEKIIITFYYYIFISTHALLPLLYLFAEHSHRSISHSLYTPHSVSLPPSCNED
jgi:hypothetical protein